MKWAYQMNCRALVTNEDKEKIFCLSILRDRFPERLYADSSPFDFRVIPNK